MEAEFAATVASMAGALPDDTSTLQKLVDKATGILDSAIVGGLAETGDSVVDPINQRLARFVSHESGIGERYHLMSLGGHPTIYALVADFGLGAPSVIRIYTKKAEARRYSLAAQIDRFTRQDFLDDSLELVPIASAPAIFVTVAGRTDNLRTGLFTAWQFEGSELRQLWASDMVQQSSYQANADDFQLTYCHDPDEANTRVCHSMVRETYRWLDGMWKLVDSATVAVPKR